MSQIAYINEITSIKLRITPPVGNTIAYTIYNENGTVYATKTMTKIVGLDVYTTQQVFTEVGNYIGKADNYEFVLNINVKDYGDNQIKEDLETINDGVKKSSLIIPHNQDLSR